MDFGPGALPAEDAFDFAVGALDFEGPFDLVEVGLEEPGDFAVGSLPPLSPAAEPWP